MRGLALLSLMVATGAFQVPKIVSRQKLLLEATSSRRDWMGSILTSGMGLLTALPASAANEKVLVLGGTGFVGSRIVSELKSMGIPVVVTSTNGREGTVALDVLSDPNLAKTVEQLAKDCTAVISCIGAIGTPNDEAIGASGAQIALGAKAAGVSNFVLMDVAPQVSDWASSIDFLAPYVKGKKLSREMALKTYEHPVLIEPTFIHGGDAFSINPPRVAGFYGSFIEAILSSGPVRGVESVLPPGFVKIALEPPNSVESVGKAAVAAALGKTKAILDSYDKINEASKLL